MRLSARSMAAMLMGLALTAFSIDSDAQYRRTESRPSASRQERPSDKRPQTKPSRPASKPSVRPNKPSSRPEVRPDHKPVVKPTRPVGRPHRPVVRPHRPHRPVVRPIARPRPVVIRPSYGTIIAANIAANMAWTAVNMAYAQQTYELANQLKLAQSAAERNAEYLYRDGVFYTRAANGEYVVMVPPAGALVEALPEDFETVAIDGNEYYRVDDTIYALAIIDGKAYFEVIGQLYK